jgi:hypothetical protein
MSMSLADYEEKALMKSVHDLQVKKEQKMEVEAWSHRLGPTKLDLLKREGALEQCRTNLKELLEDRFGQIPEELLRRIEITEDLKLLNQAIRQVYKIHGLDQLPL